MTDVLLIDGSPRAGSNTRAIITYLEDRLTDLGAAVDQFHITARGPSDEELERFLAATRHYESIVFASPLYFDGLPAVTQAFLERVHRILVDRSLAGEAATAVNSIDTARIRRRVGSRLPLAEREKGRRARPAPDPVSAAGPLFYGLIHSGFVEPAQRRPAIWTLELFARAMQWPWRGAISLGGTSPIDGRPLDEVGRLAAVAREGLALASREIVCGRPLSTDTLLVCDRSPFALLPRSVAMGVINARTRSYARKKGIDVSARPYSGCM